MHKYWHFAPHTLAKEQGSVMKENWKKKLSIIDQV